MGTALTIICSVLAGLLLAGILYMAKSRFGTQPKIRIRLLPGPSSSSSGSPGNIKITWHKKLELYNMTVFSAHELLFCWPDKKLALPVSEPNPPHINPTDTIEREFKLIKEFPRDEVTAAHDRFTHFLPEELENFVLIVSYKNDKGINFFTRYERNGDEENSTYHKRQPGEYRQSSANVTIVEGEK